MKMQSTGFNSFKKSICVFLLGMVLLLSLFFVPGCKKKEEIIDPAKTEEKKKNVESISLSKDDLSLYIGEDITKLEISVYPADAVYSDIEWSSSDTNIATVTDGVITPISEGEVEITASIAGKVCSCSIKVYKLFVEELSIEKMPDKTEYLLGDQIILEGLVLKGKMNSGKEKLFEGGFVSDIETFEEIGEKNVTVSLQDKTVNFNVTVKEPLIEAIRIATEPTQKDYVVNSFLNATGLTVEIVYENGKTKTINEGFNVESGRFLTVGTQEIKVSLGEKTTSFNVNVVPRAISSISVKTMPSNLWVVSGEKNVPKGLVLNAVYNDGTVETVESGYTVYPEVFGETGVKTVTVQYGGVGCSYNVRVDKPSVYQFRCDKYSNRLHYFVGETFDPTGIELYIWYNNGVELRLTEGFEVDTPTFTSRGTHRINVSYEGNVTWFDVIVVDVMVSTLKVTTPPSKMNYNLGDRFDPTGTVLTAYYNNGTSEVVTSGYTCDNITFGHYGETYIYYKYKEGQVSIVIRIDKPAET